MLLFVCNCFACHQQEYEKHCFCSRLFLEFSCLKSEYEGCSFNSDTNQCDFLPHGCKKIVEIAIISLGRGF